MNDMSLRNKILSKALEVDKFDEGRRAIIKIDLDHLLAVIPRTLSEEEIKNIIRPFYFEPYKDVEHYVSRIAHALANKIVKQEEKFCECPPCGPDGNCSNAGICYHCLKPIKPQEKGIEELKNINTEESWDRLRGDSRTFNGDTNNLARNWIPELQKVIDKFNEFLRAWNKEREGR